MKTKQTVSLLGLTLFVAGVLATGPFRAEAESYTIHEQTLVCGVQTPRGVRIINHGVGTSSIFDRPISEVWSYILEQPRAEGPQRVIVTGSIEETYADGQIVYSFRGTMVVRRFGAGNIQVITGTVTAIGGTGIFGAVRGGGQIRCVLNCDGHFSSSIDATLNLPGEK
jgi:hypothetical protein